MDPQLTQRTGHQGDVLDHVTDDLPALEGAKLLLRNTAGLIGKLLQTSRVAVLIDDEGVYHPLEVLGYAVAPAVSFPRGGHVLQHLEQEGSSSSVCFDGGEDALWVWDLPDGERAALEDLQADILVPIKIKGQLVAVMGLGPKKSGGAYSYAELRLLEMLVSQTGFVLEQRHLLSAGAPQMAECERLKNDLDTAH